MEVIMFPKIGTSTLQLTATRGGGVEHILHEAGVECK